MMAFLLLFAVQSVWAWKGSGSSRNPYQIQSSDHWKQLADNVAAGNDYSGAFFRMTADINTDGVSVGTNETPFAGTFDGYNHTLTYNKGAAANYAAERCAPFRFVSGATIRHLKTTGEIYSSEQYAGGIVSMVNGNSETTLTDCHSNIRLFTPTQASGGVLHNAAHGGLVGAVNTGGLLIDRCTFTGYFDGENSAGMVGWSNVDITIRNSVVDFSDPVFVNGGRTFARMAGGTKVTLTDCYFTLAVERFDGFNAEIQGECVFDGINVPEGCSYSFESEPTVNLGGKSYWKSGARVRLTAPDDVAFDHWTTGFNGCFINDPWARDAIHVLADVKEKPSFSISTQMPEAKTMHTFYGVKYRYLSKNDYHLYLSDETCLAKSWTFDSDGYLVTYDKDGDKLFITAAVGYEGNINHNFDGAWIWENAFTGTVLQNDNVAVGYDRTHLGVIAPRAFKGCTDLKTLAFQSDNTEFYKAIHQPDFIIGEEAFADCPNLTQFIMMYYNRTGSDKWDVMPPTWVTDIADNAFSGSDNCRIMVDPTVYQQYLSDEHFAPHWSRISLYMKTMDDMKVNGAVYSYMRNSKGEAVKNNAEGHEALMSTLRYWNADYQQFNATSLLANSDKNIWYTQVTGVDESSLGSDGTMRIYNDPGSYYNYKTIAIGENAFQGNEKLKAIEFWQTNGRSENSYTDLKLVIKNGAFKNCKNLKELRLFYYVQDGNDHWMALGPKDVVPGDNIFGLRVLTEEEIKSNLVNNTSSRKDGDPVVPADFRIIVSPELYPEFMEDPNWQPYLGFIEPVDYSPSTKEDFTRGGLTYSFMTNPGGILQTSQTVSQDISWWTVPRIGIEVALWAYSIYKIATTPAASAMAELISKETQAFTEWASTNQGILADEALLETLKKAQAAFATAKGKDAVLPEVIELLSQLNGKSINQLYISNNEWLSLLREFGAVDGEILNLSKETLEQRSSIMVFNISDSFAAILKSSIPQFSKSLAEHKTVCEGYKRVLQAAAKAVVSANANRTWNPILAKGFGAAAAATGTAGYLASRCWDNTFNADMMKKGMYDNILSNIHQVGLVGGGYVITTPNKNLLYHIYVKDVPETTTDAVIYAGFDDDGNSNTSDRTMTFAQKAFRNKKNLKTVSFHAMEGQSSNAGLPMLLTIPDSAFVGCDNLVEFSTLLKDNEGGTRALGPENFILAGDSIFAGLDSLKFHILIDPSRKDDFLESQMWAPLKRFFTYEDAKPEAKFKEYGGQYAYSYENNSILREHKVGGHLIQHTVVVGADNEFISGHQGALKLCNDIGSWNNYQLDAVFRKAFYGNENLRVVNFTDLYGQGAYGDCYTDMEMELGDSCFANCKNLANLDMLYLVTDEDNHIDPIKPEQVRIGKGVLEGTDARIKMMPQQVEWFMADSAWAAYKDRFMPCIIKPVDKGVKKALEDMPYYDMAHEGNDWKLWNDYIDLARIGGAGFSWLDGKFTKQKDDIRSFTDFKYFESVGLDYVGNDWFNGCSKMTHILLPSTIKTIRQSAFYNCAALPEIELPEAITSIEKDAFYGCKELNTIVVRTLKPATLGENAFPKNEGMRIYVPAKSLDSYLKAWGEYKDYIVSDANFEVKKVVSVKTPGTLAEELGLTVEWNYTGLYAGDEPHYLHGNYTQYDSLTVIGSLNDLDVWVIRYLAGNNGYDRGGGSLTGGKLRYLNLYDANIVVDDKSKAHYLNMTGGLNDQWWDIIYDNQIGMFFFKNCIALESVILPKSVTSLLSGVFEGCTNLKRVAITNATTKYEGNDYLIYSQLDNPLEELVFLTDAVATSTHSDPWGQPISTVFTKKSQVGDYQNDPGIVNQAESVEYLFEDDYVWEMLTSHGEFFPSQFLAKEDVGNIFSEKNNVVKKLKSFNEFHGFYNMKELNGTFAGDTELESVSLPASVVRIGEDAFESCAKLATITCKGDSVPELVGDPFKQLPSDFVIYVPRNVVKAYRTKWAAYADHINPDATYANKDTIMIVTTTEPNTLAEKLGLTVTMDRTWNHLYHYINSVRGDYGNITKLKVIGPISGSDLSLLRYLAGFCPWSNTRNYAGRLEYIDLYDAQLKTSDHCVAIDMHYKTTRDLNVSEENVLPAYAFLQAYNLRTLILPRTCKEVRSRALQQCEAMETLVVGDDMEEFDWNALDDDASLTRMYILSKKKMDISTEFAVWRWLCNNYNPTFDAFYVRPSLYQNYLNDDAYTGSSWQRTNNISKGAFEDDDAFAAFASHAAANADELVAVTSVEGWFDAHPGVKDLTPLRFTMVDSLSKATIAPLTQLEKVALPVPLKGMEDGLFENAKGLRYVDFLMCDSTDIVSSLRDGGFKRLGINTEKTLVYVPQNYGESNGANIVAGTKDGKLFARAFHLVDSLSYMVPYAFDTESVKNTRALAKSAIPYTVCVPYKLQVPKYARAYKLSERSGSTLTFEEVMGELEAMHPYLLKVVGSKKYKKNATTLNTDIAQEIPANGNDTYGHQDDVMGYSLRGTFEAIDNKTAAELGAYILQSDGDWHPVSTSNDKACVLPFRAYLLPSAHHAKASIGMTLEDATGIDTIETIDNDGTHRYYDLNGRELPGKPAKGVYIYKGKKYVNK